MAEAQLRAVLPARVRPRPVGERWTLLIVRDLLGGPKRYTDLRRGLPGLATDLLTERLRALEEAGIVGRRSCRLLRLRPSTS